MKIIETTDVSREGNDCYIKESVTLVEDFGVYSIITCRKYIGYPYVADMYNSKPTTDFDLAKKMYNDAKEKYK